MEIALNLFDKVEFDDQIIKKNTYFPSTHFFYNLDEIIITCNNEDLFALRIKSYSYINLTVITTLAVEDNLRLDNTFLLFLFEYIIYQIVSPQIDQTINISITSLTKTTISVNFTNETSL